MRYVYHHLGLGDHIICNGMVRHFRKNDSVTLFCYPHNEANVRYMYRDLRNLVIVALPSDQEIDRFIESDPQIKSNLIKVGFNGLAHYDQSNINFDVAFYELAGLDYQIRFSEFHFERDFNKEELVYQELNPLNEKYIFIHDGGGGCSIDVDSKYKIIKNDVRFSIFDYLKILEEAEEIHCMQSSFKDLINSYVIKARLYFHDYVRGLPRTAHTLGLNEWIICEKDLTKS